jgi:hypothetical protein
VKTLIIGKVKFTVFLTILLTAIAYLPVADGGHLYSDAAQKSDHDERCYAYNVRLPGMKKIPSFLSAEGAGWDVSYALDHGLEGR